MRKVLEETVHKAVKSGETIPLADLNRFGSLQPLPAKQARLFYAQAQSLTRFLMEGREPSRFIPFCRLLRDGTSIEEAIRKNYGRDFQTLGDFEEQWKEFVLES